MRFIPYFQVSNLSILGLWSVPKCQLTPAMLLPIATHFLHGSSGDVGGHEKTWTGEMSIEKPDDSRKTLPETINFDMKTTSLNERWTENIRKTEVSKRVFTHKNVRTVVVHWRKCLKPPVSFGSIKQSSPCFRQVLGHQWKRKAFVTRYRGFQAELSCGSSRRLLQYFDFDSKTWMNIYIVITCYYIS